VIQGILATYDSLTTSTSLPPQRMVERREVAERAPSLSALDGAAASASRGWPGCVQPGPRARSSNAALPRRRRRGPGALPEA
jgi:hypothetical protein